MVYLLKTIKQKPCKKNCKYYDNLYAREHGLEDEDLELQWLCNLVRFSGPIFSVHTLCSIG